MDMYFRGESFTNDVTIKYLASCVTVDVVHLIDVGRIRIWVNTEYVDIDIRDLFCEKARNFLNTHYYEYVKNIDKYLKKSAMKDG